MLTIITLTRAIIEVLGPDKSSVAGRGNIYLNLLCSWALDIELSLFNLVGTSNIIYVNSTVGVFLRHYGCILPGEYIEGALFGWYCRV